MGVQIKIDGVKEVLKFIETKKRNIDKGITDGSIEGGNLLAEEVRQSALGNRAEPRSFKTGAFHDSITVETSMNEAVVFSDVAHAKFLEVGTTRIPARKHFRNSANRIAPEILKKIENKIKD